MTWMKSLFGRLGVILVVIGFTIFSYAEVWGADWKLYAESDFANYYYDAEDIVRPSENIVRVWIRTLYTEKGVNQWKAKNFGKVVQKFRYENLSNSTNLWEINCAKKMHQILSSTFYNKDGSVIESYNFDRADWIFIRPDSPGESLYKAVCK